VFFTLLSVGAFSNSRIHQAQNLINKLEIQLPVQYVPDPGRFPVNNHLGAHGGEMLQVSEATSPPLPALWGGVLRGLLQKPPAAASKVPAEAAAEGVSALCRCAGTSAALPGR